jgi:hypothetical protein
MPANLTAAANLVITLFNAAAVAAPDYSALLRKMEYNVVLKRVLFSDQVSGIGNVLGYLNFHMLDRKPSLANLVILSQIPIIANEGTATTGQVNGTGNYLDDNGAGGTPTSTPISFTLSFVRKTIKDEWSLIGSFATPTGATSLV